MVPFGGPKRSFLPTSSSLLAYTQSLAKRMTSYQKMKTYRLGDMEIQGVTRIAPHPNTDTFARPMEIRIHYLMTGILIEWRME